MEAEYLQTIARYVCMYVYLFSGTQKYVWLIWVILNMGENSSDTLIPTISATIYVLNQIRGYPEIAIVQFW